jgi:hypothetical protein
LEKGRACAPSEPESRDHSNFNSAACGLLAQIKIAINKRDVPYQLLIKMWLSEKVG